MATGNKWLSDNGVLYFLQKLKALFVQKESGKGLSTNDLTNTLKANYDSAYTYSTSAHAPVDAEKNTIVTIKANGSALTPDSNRAVNIAIPSINDASFYAKGIVQLTDSTDSTDTTKAATPSAVKAVKDIANSKQSPATSLAGYGITDAYTKTEIDSKLTSAIKYKGSVDNYSDLPRLASEVSNGDMYNIRNADASMGIKAGDNVVFNAAENIWDVQSGTTDLSGCVQTNNYMTNAEIDALFT